MLGICDFKINRCIDKNCRYLRAQLWGDCSWVSWRFLWRFFLAVFELNSLNLGNNRKIRRIETLFFLTVGFGIFE